MKSRILACLTALFALGISWHSLAADGIHKHPKRGTTPPVCEPGYQIVEEIVYEDVVKTVCKMVPEYKKKWVYSTIEDPFCILGAKHVLGHGHNCHCPGCTGPYCREQLVKRQVDEPCPKMKCVTETFVERVPCVVYKKVPIETAPPILQPAPKGAPMVEKILTRPTPVADPKK